MVDGSQRQDISEEEVWYHGSRTNLAVGETLVPGAQIAKDNYELADNNTSLWLTRNLGEAWIWADCAKGEELPMVYVVKPHAEPENYAELNGWDDAAWDEWVIDGNATIIEKIEGPRPKDLGINRAIHEEMLESIRRKINKEEISRAIVLLVDRYVRLYGVNDHDINKGRCEDFCDDLESLFPDGVGQWMNDIGNFKSSHKVFSWRGKFYDSQLPDGVDDLEIIERQCRGAISVKIDQAGGK